MKVKHVLKDGKTLETVNGYKVTREQCPACYTVLEGIVRREHDNKVEPEKPGRVA